MNTYYIYIMTNKYDKVLYVGVTNNLVRRVYEHKNKLFKGFTCRYNVSKLVFFEDYHDINQDIEREKQIKGWLRKRKIELIESFNPEYNDLYDQITK
ncbi:GIY-YIG nuclease family protein [Patescibacteria group bacterium]